MDISGGTSHIDRGSLNLLMTSAHEEWLTVPTTDMITWTTNTNGASVFHQIQRQESELNYAEDKNRAVNSIAVIGIESVSLTINVMIFRCAICNW